MTVSTILIIIPIFIFSVLSIAIILDRFLFLHKNKVNLPLYNNAIDNSLNELKIITENNQNRIFDSLINNIFKRSFRSKDELREYIDSNFSNVHLELQRRIYFLGIFAKLSTLLGLFGTVVGMISAFNNIVEKGISNAGIVASGISTALLTTAIGLIVAIPTTFFHDYFNGLVESEIKKMEIIISNLLSAVFNNSKKQE